MYTQLPGLLKGAFDVTTQVVEVGLSASKTSETIQATAECQAKIDVSKFEGGDTTLRVVIEDAVTDKEITSVPVDGTGYAPVLFYSENPVRVAFEVGGAAPVIDITVSIR
jgi:hypothetical protein